MPGLSGAFRFRSGGLGLPLVLFGLLIGCSALAAFVVAADLDALSRGHRVTETRTGPLVAAVEKSLQEARRPDASRDEGGRNEGTGAAEVRGRAAIMLLLDGNTNRGDLLLRH